MGWASGSEIFDRVAQALLDAGAGRRLKYDVLVELIDVLQDQDWDTEDESLERFSHDRAIVEAFAGNGITLERDD